MWGISLTIGPTGPNCLIFGDPHAMQREVTDPGGAVCPFRRERRPRISRLPGGVEPARGLSAPREEEPRT